MYDEPVFISALQHYLYCPRQCALIHIEQQWEENFFTAEGRLLHERTDQPQTEKRKGIRTVTAMPISSEAYGLTGIADVVELHEKDGSEIPYPVEYKRGRAKSHRADEVQLCAQALCLEEMYGCDCREGALYYGKARRRKIIEIDETLRSLTKDILEKTRTLLESGMTPAAVYEEKQCTACSLKEICQPGLSGRKTSVREWLAHILKEN